MASKTLQTCVEHELAIEDDKEERLNRVQRGQWLRAAILGSNDGLLSTTSLMLGMAAASEDRFSMMLSGVAAAVAGACSMAVGEYVSVSTQRDIEQMDSLHNSDSRLCGKDGAELQIFPCLNTQVDPTGLVSPSVTTPDQRIQGVGAMSPTAGVALNDHELPENAESMTPRRRPIAASPGKLPITRGLSPARRSLFMSPKRSPVMRVISEEAREEMKNGGFKTEALPKPLQAGAASGLSFLCGAIIPLISSMFIADHKTRIIVLVIVTSIALAMFGGLGALLGGSRILVSAMRVVVGGWIAMGISYGLLKPFDKQKT